MSYQIGGMEDYRRAETLPISTINRGYEPVDDDPNDDKSVADRLREDFLTGKTGAGSPEHADIRRNALKKALLSQEQTRNNASLVCGMTPEARRQLGFTFLLIGSSISGTICHSLETSFIGHLGKDSMAARSITFSIMAYFYGISSMWSAISTKIGRAVGADDNVAIGKYFKMAVYLAFGSGVFTWSLLYPLGPLMMRTIYTLPKPTYDLAWPYMYIHAMGQPLDYLNSVGRSVLQGLQQLKYYVLMSFLDGLASGLSNYVAINVLGYGINGSAAVHVMRQVIFIFLIYGYLYRFFKEKERNSGTETLMKDANGNMKANKIDVRGAVVRWSDWSIFSKHSFYLLIAGYFGVADQQVNTILIAKMGSVDLAGNSLIGTMMSYPYIFSSAFGTVISTLGSKYIGARDDRSYLKLGLTMIILSGIIGAVLGVVVVFFADDLLRFFTNEQDVIDIIKPVFPVIVPYIAAGMVRSVMYGMAWAMQEFAYMAVIEGVSTACYIPLCLYAKLGTCASCEISLKTLMEISLICGLLRTVGITWLTLYKIPKRLRELKHVEETMGSEKAYVPCRAVPYLYPPICLPIYLPATLHVSLTG